MKNKVPQLSVIIPAFNAEDYLNECIKSVDQLKLEYEIIIVNDGSTDGTYRLISQLGLEYSGIRSFHQQNKGPAAARNFGLSVAIAPTILLLDADNVIIPDVFEEAYNVLLASDSIMAVYTDRILFGEQDGYVTVGNPPIERLFAANSLDTCALYRKSLFNITGLFDTNIPFHGNEDWEMWIRIIASGVQVQYLNKAGFKYRVRSNSTYHLHAAPNQHENQAYIFQKHASLIQACYNKLYEQNISLNQQLEFALMTKEQLKQTLSAQKLKSIGKILFNRAFKF